METRASVFLQEMATWMREDSRWLQERALVISSRVLSSASSQVRASVSRSRLPLPKAHFMSCSPSAGSCERQMPAGVLTQAGWDAGAGVRVTTACHPEQCPEGARGRYACECQGGSRGPPDSPLWTSGSVTCHFVNSSILTFFISPFPKIIFKATFIYSRCMQVIPESLCRTTY